MVKSVAQTVRNSSIAEPAADDVAAGEVEASAYVSDPALVYEGAGAYRAGALKPGVALERLTARKTDGNAASERVKSRDEVASILSKVLEDFPELKRAHAEGRVVLGTFESDEFFFQSTVKARGLFNADKRTYVIQYNEQIFARDLPVSAALGVLAHELSHSDLYRRRGLLGMLGTFFKGLSGEARARMERRTDLDAIARGYGDDLAAFRTWVYAQLSPSDLAQKRETYLSPDEIRAIEEGVRRFPALLEEWRRQPPRTLRDIREDVARMAQRVGQAPKSS